MTLLLSTLLLAAAGVSACGGGDAAGDTTQDDTAPADTATVWVEDFEYARLPGGARILSGTLVNESGAPIRNAQIEVTLFDADNRRAATMRIAVQDIEAGGRKPFREPVDTDLDVRSARVRSILFL